jgi:hypothetical protein
MFIQQKDDELFFRRLNHRIRQMNAARQGDEIDIHNSRHIVEINIKKLTAHACAGVIVQEIELATGCRTKFVQRCIERCPANYQE